MHHFHLSHSDYYRDRRSVSELCYDFPGDEILVRGLDAMQMHFANNRSNIEIPVLRVMNAAHYLAAYMLETTCSGDQTEYDTLAYASVGRDKQLTFLTMVVLAAMLKRTEGFRARNCRNLILENRSEDFDEGVTLYERFLQSSEKHFAEEDFLIDIPSVAAQLREKDELIAQQTQQITTLENTITTMEEKYQQINIGTQYKQENNHGTIYNGPVTINQYAAPQEKRQQTEDITPVQEVEPAKEESLLPFFIPEKLAALGTYSLDEFDAMYHEAVKGGAPKLAKFLKHYKELEVFETKGLNKKETFDVLKAYFGDELDFGYPNFAAYY